MVKKNKVQRALESYTKRLEYQKRYQAEKYEKLTIAVKREDILSFMKERGLNPNDERLYNQVKRYLIMLKIKEDLKQEGFLKG